MSDARPRSDALLGRTLLAAAGRCVVYWAVLFATLAAHQVPSHPWKTGLACFAAFGVVVILETLWIRTSRAASPPLPVGVGTATVVLALLLAVASYHGVTLANQD